MPIKKTSKRKPITKKWVTIDEVKAAIFAAEIPPECRKGQFVFNRAAVLYGNDFVRNLGHDPYYNDENIVPFIEELTEILNRAN